MKVQTQFAVLIILACATTALAGPARPIRSDNFQTQSPCGPPWDPIARQGQWFMDPLTGSTNAGSWEYHDDTNSLTIVGVVQNIQFAIPGMTNSNIMGFDVLVAVNNNLPMELQLGSASNSHNEVQNPGYPFYQDGMMKDARIVAEFALADMGLPPPSGSAPPYWLDPVSGGAYYIIAANEDEWAWYCWTPGDPQFMPSGNFQVPSWRLNPPDIPPGGSSTAFMQFQVSASGMPNTDYRHSVIRASQWNGWDILYNRHCSLKISHWVDTLLIDNGYFIGAPPGQYEVEPPEYIYASDCSVFFSTTHAGEKAVLQISATTTNLSPDAIQLDWLAMDAIDYHIQYCDTLSSNTWQTIPVGTGIPPTIPSPMQWIDDGSLITNLPVQQQPQRFYRLVE